MPSYRIRINRRTQQVDAEPDTPLLWVLRDNLELPGTKYGCGIGVCGACLVHMDGQPVPSCILAISRVGNSSITTIEGLTGAVAERVRQSWIAGRVPQCGYCQTGQIMRAVALLTRQSNPPRDTIRNTMAQNLCRCGTYGRIADAVERAVADVDGT